MKGSFPPKGAVEALEQLGGFAGPCFTWIRAGGPGERQQRSQDFPCEHGQQKQLGRAAPSRILAEGVPSWLFWEAG